MKFLELKMMNFGPYKGEQRVTFPTDVQHRVMVVFGDNMRGKTSLLNALRWVLYGEALGRHSTPLDTAKLVNSEAWGEGTYRMWVSLCFEAEGHQYELRRLAEPLELISIPRSHRDFNIEACLSKDGSVVAADKVQECINQFIPHQIARFYLFDAELLQEYELLLAEESEQGRAIKTAIEQVLGVPALINARDDLAILLRSAQRIQANENKHVQALQSQSEQMLRLQAELESHEKDLAETETNASQHTVEIEEIDAEMSRTQQVQETHSRLQILEQNLKHLENRQGQLRSDRLDSLKEAWKDLLQPRLAVRRQELTGKLEAFRQQIAEEGIVKDEVRRLGELLGTSVCPFCTASIEEVRRAEFGAKLGGLEVRLKVMKGDTVQLAVLSAELANLNKITATGAASRIGSIDRETEKSVVDMTRVESEIEQLRDDLRGHDVAHIARLQSKRDGLLKLKGRSESEIERIRANMGEKTARLRQLSSLMSKSPAARKQKSSLEVDIYAALEEVFRGSIDVLREKLRARVAREATETFKALTTESTYSHLSINASYGLTIVDRAHRDVSVRSAGAEQVVAMSLLSALNRVTNRPGPLVIDTPFARLDPKHRNNILRHVPNMAEQIVFLVHEGEIARDGGLAPLDGHVGAIYEIKRISSAHSQIVKA